MNEEYKMQNRKKYYRVQANVNLNAIRHNLLQIRNKLDVNTKLMAIIKADAYGHGAVPLAKAIRTSDMIDYYGVAIIEEAVELREAGIEKPILILGYTPKEQYDLVVAYDVAQTVFQFEMAEALSREAKRQGKIAKIHIKIDTGMSRIGFSDTKESVVEIKRIAALENIEIEGLFSHFARADETDKTSTKNQLDRYIEFNNRLEKEQIHIPLKHIANSAGIIEFPEAYFNMVRCGIATYGIYPSDVVNHQEIPLIPAMELKTHVIYVKDVETGVGISYGATYITDKKTRIATIPVGYADGYSRNLSNHGRVIIHGQYAPIVGKICMDQFMVDVTHIADVKQGDSVTLLGRDADAYISAEELAEGSHSFAYELVCTVGKRIPRVYSEPEYE
ncbi:MAG: alr2 [Lachnospiraceae bacterium]|jgi:alanine racemase|nr:alr2 [Lachnospiraceae bacterium]